MEEGDSIVSIGRFDTEDLDDDFEENIIDIDRRRLQHKNYQNNQNNYHYHQHPSSSSASLSLLGNENESASTLSTSSTSFHTDLLIDHNLAGYALLMFGTDLNLIQTLKLFYPTIFLYHEDRYLNIITSSMFIIAGFIFIRGIHTNKIANRFSNVYNLSKSKSYYNNNNNNINNKSKCCSYCSCCCCYSSSICSNNKKDKDEDEDRHEYESNSDDIGIEPDWTYCANVVFILASICYLCASMIHLYKEQINDDNNEDDNKNNINNNNNNNNYNNITFMKRMIHIAYLLHELLIIVTPFLFLASAICYLYGVKEGEIAHSSRKGTALYCFRSFIDYYYIATLLFVISTMTYIVSHIQYYCSFDYKLMNLSAAVMNVISAVFYLISGFQVRNDATHDLWEERRYSCCINNKKKDDNVKYV